MALVCLVRLDVADEGSILVDGEDLSKMDRDRYRKNQVAVVYQAFHLFPLLNALENIMYPLEMKGIDKKTAKKMGLQYLAEVGLAESVATQYPKMMSGGQQQRVAIARAIAGGGNILLADEPTGNLDSENEEHIVRMLKALAHEKGIYANGSTPFGYMKSKEDCHLLEPVEPEAGIIRRIFQMTLEGYSSSKIAKLFNEEGVMTPMEYKIKRGITMMKPKGNRFLWDGSTICQMLRNDFYAGDWVYGKYETNAVGGKARLKPRSEWKIYYNHHEAIIDRETFKMVQQSRGRKKSVQKREKHPLTGKIVCGCCGKNLKIEHSSNPYFFCATRYKTDSPECVKKVNVMFIEQMILYMLQQEILKQEEVSKWQQDCSVQLRERYESVIQKINRIDAEVQQIEAEKMEGYEKYRSEKILVDEYRKFMELLRGKEEKLTVEKGRLEGRLEWKSFWMKSQFSIWKRRRKIVPIFILPSGIRRHR